MAIDVAFWNINTGAFSTTKRQEVLKQWVLSMNLELLFLEEVSFTIKTDFLEQTFALTQVGRVATLDVNLDPSTKDLAALADTTNNDFQGRAVRFPTLEQRRLLLKVTEVQSAYPDLAVWCIHANASSKGGRAAVNAVNDHLAKPSGSGTVVGGDFNCPIATAGANAVHPLGHDGMPLAFTQWAKTSGSTAKGTYGITRTLYQKIQPHQVIDYVLHGPARTVVAQPCCTSAAIWTEILAEFDHCPVVYRITG